MVTEQGKTLKALQAAIQMEIDGKAFYLKASQESSNQLGQELMRSLATEEDIHREKFKEIFDTISSKESWPAVTFHPDGGKGLRTIFARVTEGLGSNIRVLATELDFVKRAMDMENKTYDFYKSRADEAGYEVERDLYQTLAAEEKAHHLALLDYYEYLKDPAAWFVKKEHPSLDGG